jgi:hypothetical protein
MTSNSDYAAMVMLGHVRIEAVPEARQRSVDYLIARCGTDPNPDPVKLVGQLMRRVEGARRA